MQKQINSDLEDVQLTNRVDTWLWKLLRNLNHQIFSRDRQNHVIYLNKSKGDILNSSCIWKRDENTFSDTFLGIA